MAPLSIKESLLPSEEDYTREYQGRTYTVTPRQHLGTDDGDFQLFLVLPFSFSSELIKVLDRSQSTN